VPEGSQNSAIDQDHGGKRPVRARSAGVVSDDSPSWEAASVPAAEAGESQCSNRAASGKRLHSLCDINFSDTSHQHRAAHGHAMPCCVLARVSAA
jgi:hypothetical protein